MIADLTNDGRAMIELKEHRGFAVLCENFDEAIAALQTAINDEAHDGEETQRNKRARTALQNAHPRFLLEQMIAAAKKEFRAEIGESTQPNRRN